MRSRVTSHESRVTTMTMTEYKPSAKDVQELRQRTGAGMMDCRNALTAANGDMNLAVENLRKSGIAKASTELIVIIEGKPSLGASLQNARDLSDAAMLIAVMIIILMVGMIVDGVVFGALERGIRRRRGLAETA